MLPEIASLLPSRTVGFGGWLLECGSGREIGVDGRTICSPMANFTAGEAAAIPGFCEDAPRRLRTKITNIFLGNRGHRIESRRGDRTSDHLRNKRKNNN